MSNPGQSPKPEDLSLGNNEGRSKKPRRWLRRLLFLAAGLIVFAVFLALLAPTFLTSEWAERKASAVATDALGRPVVIEGLAFGWRTPLHLSRVEIPPRDGEHGHAVLRIEDVEVPLTLTGVLRMPPYAMDDLRVGRLEANAVRNEDGEWNLVTLAEELKRKFPATDKPSKEEAPPSPLPISSLRVRVDRIDLRAVDMSRGHTAGWENGSLEVLWPGDISPLTLDVAGDLRSSDQRMPWDVRAKIEHWIDADRMVTPRHAMLTSSSDGMMHAGQITDGGYFLRVDGSGGEESVGRVVIPLRPWAELAKPALSADAFVPQLQGDLELTFRARHDGGFERWNVEAGLATREIVAKGAPMGPAPHSVPNLSASFSAALDLARRRVDDLSASFDSPALKALVRGGDLDFNAPSRPGRLEARAHLDIEKLWLLGASFLSASEEAGLTGSLDFTAHLLPPHDAEHRLQVALDVVPGEFRSLAPFAVTPTDLPLPVDLSPMTTRTSATLAIHPGLQKYSVPTFGAVSELWESSGSAMVDVSGEAPVWEASLAAAMDFTRIGEAYGELLARFGFFDLQGRVRGRLDVAGTGDGRIATRGDFKSQGAGASLPFEDRSVRLEQSEVVLGWDLEANPADSEFVVRGVTVRAPNMSLSVEGTASPRAIDLSGDLEVALEPILAIGELFKPIPIGLAGDLRTRFSLKGTMGSDFRGELTVQSAGPVRYTQMGTEIFAEPLHLEASAEAKWKEGELAEVVLAIPSAGIGEEADAALDLIANMRDGTGVRGTARFSVGIPLILGFVPPERLDEMELEIAATGALEGNIAFDAPLVLAPELRLADQWNVTGDLITDLPEVEWLMGEMGEYLGGVRDERKFTVAINPNSPMDFLYSDHAVTSVGEVFGPMDLQVAEIRIENATRFQMEAPILIDLPSGRIGEFLFPTDTMALALPATTFASKMRIDLEESTFEVSRLDVAVQDVGAGGGTGNFNWGDFSWSLNSELEVSDLANAVALVTLEPTMTDLLPEVGGQVVVSTKLVGGDPRPPFDLAAGLPVRGNATINWKDVFAREDPMWWASGIAGSARFDSSDDGKSASLDWNVGIEELGAEAIRAKPVREFATHGRLNLRDFDELALHVVEIRAGNYDVRGEGKLTASGLKPFLLEGEGDGIESWLRGPRFDGNAFIRANLGAFDGAHPLLATGGVMDWTGRIGSTPGRLLEIESNLGADSVYLAYAEMFELEGLTGRWNAVKTYRLDPSVRLPSRPTEGKFTVARMAFSKPPASGDFVDSVVTIRGFETGLRLSVGVRDFLGGPATGSFSVTEESGAPVLRGEMEITGLRGGKLSPSLRDLGAREDEMSGIATMSWRIPDSPESNVLDDLSIRLRSTQIGKKALSRLLQALDANQDDPRFQNAIMALNFGAPVGGHFFLENSMISMGTRLRLPAGVMLPLPILDRAPLSEIIAVYGMQQRAGAISALHDPLLLMLQTDLYAGESMTTQAGALP